ncbi:putative lipid II flippase FtsW [bacterium]|nr:putative lipid II flippase FtsW [bacterium]
MSLYNFHSSQWGHSLLIVSSILLVTGMISLISASAVIGIQKHNDVFYFVKKQLLGILLGALLGYIVLKMPVRFWQKTSSFLLIINIILIILCFVPSLQAPGAAARRWIKLGPFTVQPSEFLKITYSAFVASLLAKFSLEERRKVWGIPFIIFIFSLAVISGIILKQPSTGTLFTLVTASIAMYLAAGMTPVQLLSLALIVAIGGFYVVQKTPYRLERIIYFMSPEKDPLGKGYHILQSLLGIGSGGLWGVGWGRSVQKFNYLPESHTDAIFAIIAEEFGFIGSVFILFLFLMLFSLGLKIARSARTKFETFFAIGLICNICIQALINIGVMTGVFPFTGVPLPFISYGGSAMITTLVSVALLYKIALKRG